MFPSSEQPPTHQQLLSGRGMTLGMHRAAAAAMPLLLMMHEARASSIDPPEASIALRNQPRGRATDMRKPCGIWISARIPNDGWIPNVRLLIFEVGRRQ